MALKFYEFLVRGADGTGNYKGSHLILRDDVTGALTAAASIALDQLPAQLAALNIAAHNRVNELDALQAELDAAHAKHAEIEAALADADPADAKLAEIKEKAREGRATKNAKELEAALAELAAAEAKVAALEAKH